MKKNPKTKKLHGQELLDFITQKIRDYSTEIHKIVVTDPSVKHIARRISIQYGNTDDMINDYLKEVRRNILLYTTHYAKSEFSIPWIHKWTPEVGYTEEQIPCLYRVYYNNFWDKMIKKDPKTKELHGQELSDFITQKIRDYSTETHKIVVTDPSVKHIARRISIKDGNTDDMINDYLKEVRINILLYITHYAKSDTSIRSETSEDAQEDRNTQPCGDSLQQTEDFLFSLKGNEDLGFPPLIAERVKKTLRDVQGVILYGVYTYGKLIGACTQEGINLSNELKLSKQLKIDRLRERFQLGAFVPSLVYRIQGRSEELIVRLIDLRRIDLGDNSPRSSATNVESSKEEIDLSEFSDNNQQENTNACRCRGDICSCENDEFYKLQCQFEYLNINTSTANNVI
ncbi:hypothetical protein H5410_002654 [Solanum commersonii]|uniref:Uncharacterized protein n=1 Tax=Solanum commersonii TaxID=4109 RepID=A0A9J6B2K6_SOLCO|nr:hypothetical protein H5410_002654 [Solanum commersonii]